MRVMKCWNSLSKEGGEVSCLETFNARLQGSEQPNLLEGVPVHCKGAGLDDI